MSKCRRKTNLDIQQENDEFDCLELPLSEIKYILGPCVYYQYTIGGRKFYLFGEAHSDFKRSRYSSKMNSENTLLFSSFVHSFTNQHPEQTYDLFFESMYFLQKEDDEIILEKGTSSTSNTLNIQFSNCIIPKKRTECSYRNLRTHYIDYRRSKEWEYFNHLIQTQQSLTPEIKQGILNFVNTNKKFIKQFNNIRDPVLRVRLWNYIYIGIFKILETDDRLLTLNNYIMDMYAMLRMFREFDPRIDKSGFKGTSQNVIYYAGAIHIETMVFFIEQVLGIPREKSVLPKHGYGGCKTYNYIKLDVSTI